MKSILFFLLIPLYLSSSICVKNKDIENFYTTWKKEYLIKEKNLYRVATDKTDKSRTVSEGQGYGMLFAVLLEEDSKTFDALFGFVRAHKSAISKKLMAWQVPEVEGENDSAFDGDADIAYALIKASQKWGNKSTINYKKEANQMLDAIWKYTIGKESFLPLLGDWVNPHGKRYNQYTVRTSDFMFGHFREFYNFSHDKKWLKVLQATQHAMKEVQNSKTGLVPDFITYDRKKRHFIPAYDEFLEQHDGAYYYNACRVPFRVGVDALNSHDKTSKEIAKKLSSWSKQISNNNPLALKSGFSLEGKVIGNYFSTLFIAPMGVAAMSCDRAWGENIYESVKTRYENYFEDSVTLLSLMAMRGIY